MARVRNNQGYRKKVLDVFIRPYLEQENTQERESYLQERESIKPLQDKTWQLASNIVSRFYTPKDVQMENILNKTTSTSQNILIFDLMEI